MENEATFVAPEGVYTVTEEHKPSLLPAHAISVGPILFPTRISSAVVKFPATKPASAPGFAQLLGGNKDLKREKTAKDREDGISLSSSDTPDEGDHPISSTQEHVPGSPSSNQDTPHTLFSHPPAASKKKHIARPKHNIRTTSSTFVTRIQTAEGLTKVLQSKQGDITFLFYNLAKSFLWVEAGSKLKVSVISCAWCAVPNA